MSRWFYLFLPLVSAMALVAALMCRPVPRAYEIGCVDPDRLFERQTDYILLQQAESIFRRITWTRNLSRVLGASDSFPRRVVDSEWRLALRGLGIRSDRLAAMWSKGIENGLETNYMELLDRYSVENKKIFEVADQQLKAVRDGLVESEPENSLKDERFRLMNLRLELKVLTRDPFVFSDERLVRIQNEVDSIQQTIDRAEQARLEEQQRYYRLESGRIRGEYLRETKKNQNERESRANQMLRETENLLKSVVEDNRVALERRTGDARRYRENTVAAVDGGAAAPPISSGDVLFPEIQREIRSEFDRRLRRKGPAVAERKHLSAILMSVWPVGPCAEDVTEAF
jgi:hypothetical protein